MVGPGNLTEEQREILNIIEKSTAEDLARPQELTPEETRLLDLLDEVDPVPPPTE